MAKKNLGRLAGLAALAGAAYMMSKGKGKSDDAGDQKTSSYTGDTKKVGSDGVPLKTPAQSIAAADKSDKSTSISTNGASGTTTPGPDKSVSRLDTEPNKPAKPANAPKPDRVGNPSQSKGVLLSDRDTAQNKPLYKQKDVTIGGVKKRTEGNEPMPSLKAVEAKVASNRTDALRNASRKTAASNTPKSKTPPAPTTSSKVGDAAKEAAKTAVNAATQGPAASTAPANKFKHEMPITKFFKGIRERGDKDLATRGMKHGGSVKMASGGMAASRRGDGIAQRGKTRGKMC
jgi:hypothetical protein